MRLREHTLGVCESFGIHKGSLLLYSVYIFPSQCITQSGREVMVSLVFWLNVISVYSGGMCCLAQIHSEKCLLSVEAECRP